jgi:hypothetical protein
VWQRQRSQLDKRVLHLATACGRVAELYFTEQIWRIFWMDSLAATAADIGPHIVAEFDDFDDTCIDDILHMFLMITLFDIPLENNQFYFIDTDTTRN